MMTRLVRAPSAPSQAIEDGRVAVGVLPGLEVVADEHGVEADLLRGAGKIEQLVRPELLSGRLVSDPQHHALLLVLVLASSE